VFFPEFLYQLSARDQQVTWLDPLIQDQATTALLADISVDITVPDARILVLKNLTSQALPGAAQNVSTFHLLSLVPPTPGTNSIELTLIRNALAVGVNSILTWTGDVLVPPGWRVRARAVFNAAAAANTVGLDVVGILIPVGNIQRL
jgi:hypothetical protein